MIGNEITGRKVGSFINTFSRVGARLWQFVLQSTSKSFLSRSLWFFTRLQVYECHKHPFIPERLKDAPPSPSDDSSIPEELQQARILLAKILSMSNSLYIDTKSYDRNSSMVVVLSPYLRLGKVCFLKQDSLGWVFQLSNFLSTFSLVSFHITLYQHNYSYLLF